MGFLILGTAMVTWCGIAEAQARTLVKAGGGIIVWKDEKAHGEGVNLISAGVNKTNPALLVPLVACIVSSGAQAVVTDGGFFSSTITVVSGKESGCRGVIPNDYLGKK